jgi:hypothetical protein
MKFQTGWGNNITRLADVTPNPPIVPPLQLGFIWMRSRDPSHSDRSMTSTAARPANMIDPLGVDHNRL